MYTYIYIYVYVYIYIGCGCVVGEGGGEHAKCVFIEDAIRRDTAAPFDFWARRFRDSFRHVAFGCLCLAIVWLISFDLV